MLTNEERRVGIYTEAHQPIDPAQVTPDTPLEALNLNWRERDLPERVRTKHVHRSTSLSGQSSSRNWQKSSCASFSERGRPC
jgi:hypothetical protein